MTSTVVDPKAIEEIENVAAKLRVIRDEFSACCPTTKFPDEMFERVFTLTQAACLCDLFVDFVKSFPPTVRH